MTIRSRYANTSLQIVWIDEGDYFLIELFNPKSKIQNPKSISFGKLEIVRVERGCLHFYQRD